MPVYRLALLVEVEDTRLMEAKWIAETAVKTLAPYGVQWVGFIAQQRLPADLGVGEELSGKPLCGISGTNDTQLKIPENNP